MSEKHCALPDGVDIKPDGIHSLDPCIYEDIEIHQNVTVIVSRCKNCGKIDISWLRTPETESTCLSV